LLAKVGTLLHFERELDGFENLCPVSMNYPIGLRAPVVPIEYGDYITGPVTNFLNRST
jgi:hypothetical protein